MIVQLLEQWETNDAYADIILDVALTKHKFAAQDAALVQEIFFGVVRWLKKLDWMVGQIFLGKWSKSPRFVRYTLLSSVFQLLYLERIPEYAVINEAVDLVKKRGGQYWAGKVNAVLRNFLKKKTELKFPELTSSPLQFISINYSFPEWLVQRWLSQWGLEQTIALCEASNERPAISLRVNQLKTTTAALQEKLSAAGIEVATFQPGSSFLKVTSLPGLNNFPLLQQGYFSVQDESAGLACLLLDPQPGERIVDLCAAPGGKTGFLLELSRQSAHVFAVDLNFSRLQLIRENLNRLGIVEQNLVQADGRQFYGRKVDKILIDAPCSGLGVLAKRVDLRWRRTAEQIQDLTRIQTELLQHAAELIKSGGVIVYSTCTIDPDENERVIEKFLAADKRFEVEPASHFISEEFTTNSGFVRTFPHIHRMDGSFAVRLVKH